MKLLLSLLLIISLSSCYSPERHTYTGSQPHYSRCHSLFDLGYNFDIKKCEDHISNPKHKIGKRLTYIKGFDKNCYGIVLGLDYGIHNNVNYYYVDVTCNGKVFEDKQIEE